MTAAQAIPVHIQAQIEAAERLAREGQIETAASLFQQVLAAVPEHSRALGFFAMRAYADGELATARALIDRAAAGWPRAALIEGQRATILLALGDREAALGSLENALALDPGFVPARLDLAQLLDQLGRPRDAAEHYRAALAKLPPLQSAPAPLRARIEQAQQALAREQAELEATIVSHIAPTLAGLDPEDRARFDECLDIFLGRKRPQLPKPGMMHFPKLAPLTFFPRSMFDWIQRAEAAWETVRAEVVAMLAQGDAGFIPYVQKPQGEHGPGTAWNPLNHQPDWGAYFLFNQGQRVERHCAACPLTSALLESLPLVRIPGRAPTAFFSRLKPGTHIPPHHGATNTRLVAHLPLIVPPRCALRVGNDVREWVPGQALVFDDTIEHEAWNESSEDRVVLIFDVWNPYLSVAERELVTTMTAALAEFYPGQQHQTDF